MRTVGEMFKEERIKKNISLSEVEDKIRVREKFITALEDNNWSVFSSKVYIVGLIKTYSKFLGLDSKKMTAFFRRDYERKEDVKFKQKVSSSYLMPETRKVAGTIFFILILAFVGYFLFQLKIFLSPPTILFISPQKSVFSRVEKIKVAAKTEKEAAVTIFGDRVFQDKEGIFIYDYPLKVGKNTLIVEIVGANGKKAVFKKEFTRNQ